MSFEPHLRKFYVSAEDPFYIKELKLEILTRIATEGNISEILIEFQVFFFFFLLLYLIYKATVS